MKKISLLIFLLLILFCFQGVAKAVDTAKPLEINYPEISGESPQNAPSSVPNYIKYIYVLFIAISGIIALGVLIYAGFRYLTSAGDATKLSDAKSRMVGAFLGLVLLLLSYLILNTINPRIPVLTLYPPIPTIQTLTPGVYVCQTSEGPATIERNWRLQKEYYAILKDLRKANFPEDQINFTFKELKRITDEANQNFVAVIKTTCKSVNTTEGLSPLYGEICFVPATDDPNTGPNLLTLRVYGAIIVGDKFKRISSGGGIMTQVFFDHYVNNDLHSVSCNTINPNVISAKVVMIQPFIFTRACEKPASDVCGADLFQEENFNKGYPPLPYTNIQTVSFSTSSGWLPIETLDPPPPKSMKVLPEVIAVLYKNPPSQGAAEGAPFLPGNYTNLLEYEAITDWVPCDTPGIYSNVRNDKNLCAKPAATTIILLPAKTL